MAKANEFKREDAERVLLWCQRHCCVCGIRCGLHMELHHIDDPQDNDEDNCLPVCYNCHGMLSHYDPKQPRGRSFRSEELKKTRNQIYEEHTQHLVPVISCKMTHHADGLPKAHFMAAHEGGYPPVKVLFCLKVFKDGKHLSDWKPGVHYNGLTQLNFNPGQGLERGLITLPPSVIEYNKRLLVQIQITIIDPYKRPHKLLPFGYVHLRYSNGTEGWYYEPAPEEPAIRHGG